MSSKQEITLTLRKVMKELASKSESQATMEAFDKLQDLYKKQKENEDAARKKRKEKKATASSMMKMGALDFEFLLRSHFPRSAFSWKTAEGELPPGHERFKDDPNYKGKGCPMMQQRRDGLNVKIRLPGEEESLPVSNVPMGITNGQFLGYLQKMCDMVDGELPDGVRWASLVLRRQKDHIPLNETENFLAQPDELLFAEETHVDTINVFLPAVGKHTTLLLFEKKFTVKDLKSVVAVKMDMELPLKGVGQWMLRRQGTTQVLDDAATIYTLNLQPKEVLELNTSGKDSSWSAADFEKAEWQEGKPLLLLMGLVVVLAMLAAGLMTSKPSVFRSDSF